MGNIKKKRKNNRNNKKNKIKKALLLEKSACSVKLEEQNLSEEGNEDANIEDNPLKRSNSFEDQGNDSEDDAPKRKKKKKPSPQETGENKKGKKSIRQMKREKYLQRLAEAEAVAKDQHKSECLSYLSQWKHDKSNWKFMKAKQVWLYKNKFSSLIPDESWPVLLEYFESTQGNIRNLLLEDANKVIKQMDEWTESQNKPETEKPDDVENEESSANIAKPDSTSYKRARDLIQCLAE